MPESADEVRTIRWLAEAVEPPWLVWTDESLERVLDTFWPYHSANLQLSVRWLDGSRMRSPEALFDEFSAALQFPFWFGRNWNAFIDLMRQPEWEKSRSYLIIIRNCEAVLVEDAPDGLGHLCSVLEGIAEDLAAPFQYSYDQMRPSTPFHVVFHCGAEKSAAWAARQAAEQLAVPALPLRDERSWAD